MHAVPRHGKQRPAPSSFRTFSAVGRRSAVAAGEFSELLSRPADRGAHPRDEQMLILGGSPPPYYPLRRGGYRIIMIYG